MDLNLLIACSVMMTLMVVLPGPDWAYLIAAGTRERTILPSLAGILLGYVVTVAAVAVGVGAVVAAMPWFITALTLAAAAYLVWLGVRVLRDPPALAVPGALIEAVDAASAPPAASDRAWRRLVQGAGVSGLNPKGLLVLVVLLPQFTSAAAAWPLPVQLGVLGLVYLTACAVVYTVVAYGARSVMRWRPSAMRIISRVSGAAMVLLAIALVGEQAVHLWA